MLWTTEDIECFPSRCTLTLPGQPDLHYEGTGLHGKTPLVHQPNCLGPVLLLDKLNLIPLAVSNTTGQRKPEKIKRTYSYALTEVRCNILVFVEVLCVVCCLRSKIVIMLGYFSVERKRERERCATVGAEVGRLATWNPLGRLPLPKWCSISAVSTLLP